MKWEKITGLMAATFTPMKADGSLNLALIKPYIGHLLNSGVNQVYVNGTTGEAHSLTVEERKQITEAWITHGKGKLQRIVVHCGAGNLTDTKELIKHAAGLGVDGIAVIAPVYFKPRGIKEVVDYCQEAAAVAPNSPFMYYHFPGQTQINIRITDFLKEAHGKIPNLIGVKFTSIDLHDANDARLLFGNKYDIVLGADTLMLPALAMGFAGFIGISFNILGKVCSRLVEAVNQGDLIAARREQERTQQFANAIFTPGDCNDLVSGMKAAVSFVETFDLGPPRSPIIAASETRIERMKQTLNALNFKEWH